MPPLPSNSHRPPGPLRGDGYTHPGPLTLGQAVRDPSPASRVFGVLSGLSIVWGGRAWWGAVVLGVGLVAIVVTELIRVRKAVKSVETPPAT